MPRRWRSRSSGERGLGAGSLVMEVASNDGYLLQYFAAAGVPVLGIEPAVNVAAVARDTRSIPTLVEWFGRDLGRRLAAEGTQADVILGLNVMAHVPDFNGFLAGLAALLKPSGVAVIEVPYVRDMVEKTEFDTIYHEHLFYFSVSAVAAAAARHGLVVQRVDRMPVHGGSLRLFLGRGRRSWPDGRAAAAGGSGARPDDAGVLRRVPPRGRTSAGPTGRDGQSVCAAEGATIGGYGAAAKATILLNYCGLTAADVAFVADRSPHKQGRRMPGCGIRSSGRRRSPDGAPTTSCSSSGT